MPTCMTAVDALYAEPFPAYDVLADFVLHELPRRNEDVNHSSAMMMWGELGEDNHSRLERVFKSKGDLAEMRTVGAEIDATGGMQAMLAMFDVYFHFVVDLARELGLTEEQAEDAVKQIAMPLECAWNGIGVWNGTGEQLQAINNILFSHVAASPPCGVAHQQSAKP